MKLRKGIRKRAPTLTAWAFALAAMARRARWRAEGAERPPGINFAGYLSRAFGLGESARLVARSLVASGIPCAFTNVRHRDGRDAENPCVPIVDDFPYSTTILHLNAPDIRRLVKRFGHRPLLVQRLIGIWYWELERLPSAWRAVSSAFDEIWFASEWARAQFEDQLWCRSERFPLPADLLTRAPIADATALPFDLPNHACVFLQVFDFKSSIHRKNPAGALRAYLQAFPRETDETRLVLKSISGDSDQHALAELRALARGRRDVLVWDGNFTPNKMHALYDRADCFLSLHRSEGLGLGILEALGRGKLAIFTDYSGPAEFRSLDGALAVPYRPVPVYSEMKQYRGGVWAEPDLEYAAERMREVAKGSHVRSRTSETAHTSDAFLAFLLSRLARGES